MSTKGRVILGAVIASLIPAVVGAQSAMQHLKNGQEARVVKVKAGHAIIAKVDGAKVPVRVLGIECPNSKKSFAQANRMLLDERVTLESDKPFLPILKDQHGNFVAYVQLEDGSDYGKAMIEKGGCTDKTWSAPHPRATLYAQARAR